METELELNSIPPDKTVGCLLSFLRGTPQQATINLMAQNNGIPVRFEIFKNMMLEMFEPKDFQIQLRYQLMNLKNKHGESINNYNQRF